MGASAVFTSMRCTALFAVLAAVVVAAQASSSSVAAASVSGEFAAGSSGQVAATVVRQWRADLRSAALLAPGDHFKNLSRSTLLDRLRIQAARKNFAVVSVQLLRPRQLAPLVVVKAVDKHAFVAATPAILKAIDPKRSTGDDRTGWAYEGFLLEAVDGNGVPFLVVFNHWRGPHAGGGQWASDPSLFPFAHG
jgi:hypothetical protein